MTANIVVDTRSVPVSSTGDYNLKQLGVAVGQLLHNSHVAANWWSVAKDMDDKRTLWFCPKIDNAYDLKTDLFRARQISKRYRDSEVLIGDTPEEDRADIFRRFESGQLTNLISVDVISEGVDVPAVSIVVSLRPTKSPVLFLQQNGRGNRVSDADKLSGRKPEYVYVDRPAT